jgi:hypothetical protein
MWSAIKEGAAMQTSNAAACVLGVVRESRKRKEFVNGLSIQSRYPASISLTIDATNSVLEVRSRLCMTNHIQIDRAWILIQEGSFPLAEEAEHLEKCSECREFLQSFVCVGQYIGFSVNLPNIDSAAA